MTRPIRLVLALIALLAILGAVIATMLLRSPTAPDALVFHNGTIRTVSAAGIVEAIYVQDGRIAAVGRLDQVLAAAPRGARRIDLEGGTLTPGLIEPHTHPLAAALLNTAIDISGRTHSDRAAIMTAIAEGVEAGGPSPWAIAFGWDAVMLDDLTPPSLAELDALSPDRPLVILTQMMHEAFANSAALEAAGLSPATPDPHDGFFERDADGALTGRVVEVTAVRQLMAGIPQASDAALTYLLDGTYDAYAAAGYTTIGIASLVGRAEDPLGILTAVSHATRPALNTVLYTSPSRYGRAQGMFNETDDRHALRRLNGMKLWLDGSPFAGGAATDEPYANTPLTQDTLGLPPNWLAPLARPSDSVIGFVGEMQGFGYQMALHVQGERAIDLALDAIDIAQTRTPDPDVRHRLEHLALITPDQIARANGLGVSLGFFPDHIGNYGHRLEDLFGQERAARYMPIAEAVRQGAVVTIHGDHPASEIDAVRVMALPVHRRTLTGDTLGETIDAETALTLMTRNAARQLGLADEIGSIEVGKRADLTWFDTDPVAAIDADAPVAVRGTWLAGQPVDTRDWSLDRIGLAIAAAWGQVFG
ncbi:amidohydrolase [Maricaulis maris]|uniref:amidohydrolase n=1 Tax=Maricaulis maris TaxID=74318 RepID=UPI003B8C9391